MRASTKHPPGLCVSSDSAAYVDMACMDYIYYDGKVQEPLEKPTYITELPYPKSEYISQLRFAQDLLHHRGRPHRRADHGPDHDLPRRDALEVHQGEL